MHSGLSWGHIYHHSGLSWGHIYHHSGISWVHIYHHSGISCGNICPTVDYNGVKGLYLPTRWDIMVSCFILANTLGYHGDIFVITMGYHGIKMNIKSSTKPGNVVKFENMCRLCITLTICKSFIIHNLYKISL